MKKTKAKAQMLKSQVIRLSLGTQRLSYGATRHLTGLHTSTIQHFCEKKKCVVIKGPQKFERSQA